MEDTPAVVLDCGTCLCRVGLSNDSEDSPPIVIPNVVGRPKCNSSNVSKSPCIGESALTDQSELKIRFPIEYGHVTNWDEMQLMWQALIDDKLRVQATEHPFVLTQICNTSRGNLEKTAEIFFENFDVPSLLLIPSTEASLMAAGIDTGITVEIGGGACFCVPVFNGYGLRHLQQRTEFSGRDLTTTLSKMISKKCESSEGDIFQFDFINLIKEKYCYCAENYEEECNLFSKEKEIVHHFSGINNETKSVRLGMEQFQCPESLFKPSLAGKEFPGLHEIVVKCLNVEDDNVRNELASNIVLCGGSSLFPGLAQRLQNELKNMTMTQASCQKINVSVSPFQHAAFQGGKMAANCTAFLKLSMSKESYDEYGPSRITKQFRR